MGQAVTFFPWYTFFNKVCAVLKVPLKFSSELLINQLLSWFMAVTGFARKSFCTFLLKFWWNLVPIIVSKITNQNRSANQNNSPFETQLSLGISSSSFSESSIKNASKSVVLITMLNRLYFFLGKSHYSMVQRTNSIISSKHLPIERIFFEGAQIGFCFLIFQSPFAFFIRKRRIVESQGDHKKGCFVFSFIHPSIPKTTLFFHSPSSTLHRRKAINFHVNFSLSWSSRALIKHY